MENQIKLIVGLGNPGTKYTYTRHNLGFLALDYFLHQAGEQASQNKFDGLHIKCLMGGTQRVFVKPQSFMNLSGVVVRKYLESFYIEPSEMLVIHDEADLEEGMVRLKKAGGAGGHNGLRSIMDEIGTDNFYRLRIGTGKHETMELASFLLAKASVELLEPLASKASDVLQDVFQNGFVKAQIQANQI